MTIATIVTDVTANLGNRADLDQARVLRMVNYSQKAIMRITPWRYMLSSLPFTHITWAGTSLDADSIIDIEVCSAVDPQRIRTILSVVLNDTDENERGRLQRVSTFKQWDETREMRLNDGATRGLPTHYFWTTKTHMSVWPVPDQIYSYAIRGYFYPPEIDEISDDSSLVLKHCDDIITARCTYLLALGLNMPDHSREWKGEYQAMLRDLFTADKDKGDVDMAAFRQETNLNGSSQWWTDPFVSQVDTSQV